jgi:hypothetical protein
MVGALIAWMVPSSALAGEPFSKVRPAASPARKSPAQRAKRARAEESNTEEEAPKPPPLHVDYASYGVAVAADILAHPGETCGQDGVPCILGSGGGLALRGGYRSPGPWYFGGAYQFTTTNSSNLYRLAVLQQLRAEMRFIHDLGYRTTPYYTWGLGGVVYGNEWGVETGGGSIFAGAGVEIQLSRVALLGLGLHYQPIVFAGFIDTADYERDPGVAQYIRVELMFELRQELSRQ